MPKPFEIKFIDLVTAINEPPELKLNEKVEKMFFGVLEILKSSYYSLDKTGKQLLAGDIYRSAYSILERREAEEIKNKSEEK
jgi:hypothetical protein